MTYFKRPKPRDADVACTHNTTHTTHTIPAHTTQQTQNKTHTEHTQHTTQHTQKQLHTDGYSINSHVTSSSPLAHRQHRLPPTCAQVWGSTARRRSQRAGPGGKFVTLIELQRLIPTSETAAQSVLSVEDTHKNDAAAPHKKRTLNVREAIVRLLPAAPRSRCDAGQSCPQQ